MRLLSSKELGISFPFIGKIAIGRCGSHDLEHSLQGIDPSLWLAHAHVCPKDRSKGLVCFKYIKDIYGPGDRIIPSSIFWHEYAHLLDTSGEFQCPHDTGEYIINFDYIQKTGHGEPWKKIMGALGQMVPWYYEI